MIHCVRGQRPGELNDNESLTDPLESGEWAGEEVQTVLKLQLHGSRQAGARRREAGNEICSMIW